MTTTTAAVLERLGEPLALRTLTLPQLRPGQVLVQVHWSGVCHSQLNEIRGRKGPDRFLPHTLGHEGSGIVERVGEGVTKVRPGDRVVLTWIKGHGADVPSTVYGSAEGPVNSGAVSTFLERTIASENRVVPVPAGMPLREAALLGCAIPTGAGIVQNTARVQVGQSVAVFGIGGVGSSAVLAARLAGAATIVAVDIDDAKLEHALGLGATHAVNAGREEAPRTIQALTQGRGVDVAIEAAGKRASMESAFQSVRDAGGLAILAGNLAKGETITIDPMDLIRGKRLLGTWGGETDPEVDIPRYADAIRAGRLQAHRLIGREYPLAQIDRAFDELEKGFIGRGLVRMTHGGSE